MRNQTTEQMVEELPGEERGLPSVSVAGPSKAMRGLIAGIIAAVFLVGGSVAFWKVRKRRAAQQQQETTKKDMQPNSAVPAHTFEETPPPVPGVKANPASGPIVPAPEGAAPPLPGPEGRNGGGGGMASSYGGFTPVTLDKSGSSLMVVSNKQNTASNSADNSAYDRIGNPNGGLPGDTGSLTQNSGPASLTASRNPTVTASMLGNRNFILAKGSFIDCVLQTRLDSTVSGMVACVVTRNIYSDNGKVLLLERGSTLTGEYKSAMKQGMARIFVLWDRVKTPNGVIINLDSPGTDPLGGSGLPGYVDTHFWKRFGGALLLSLVDDVARAATTQTSSTTGNQFNFNSTSDAVQNMATEALKNTINIPPTLYKNQGEQIGVYVAHDLDFSSVYDVAAQ